MTEKVEITLNINGRDHIIRVEPRRTLVDAIREDCGQTGTHIGCEHGICGACTIILDDDAVRSCLMFAVQVQGKRIRTVEGLEGWRQAASDADRVHDAPCSAMRLLHAWLSHAGGLRIGAKSGDHRRGDPGRPLVEPMPLHGLPEYRQSRAERSRCSARGSSRLTAGSVQAAAKWSEAMRHGRNRPSCGDRCRVPCYARHAAAAGTV